MQQGGIVAQPLGIQLQGVFQAPHIHLVWQELVGKKTKSKPVGIKGAAFKQWFNSGQTLHLGASPLTEEQNLLVWKVAVA